MSDTIWQSIINDNYLVVTLVDRRDGNGQRSELSETPDRDKATAIEELPATVQKSLQYQRRIR